MKKILSFFKWVAIIFVALIILGVISSIFNGGKNTPTSNNNSSGNSATGQTEKSGEIKQSTPAKPKEGDVISGISRKDLEDKYNDIKKNQSKLKADEYKKSLVGQDVVWIAKTKDVDTGVDGVPYVSATMGVYTVRIKDPGNKFSDLNKGTLVKITGKISDIFEFVGIDVYIDATTVEAI
jgi:hypothetical protein